VAHRVRLFVAMSMVWIFGACTPDMPDDVAAAYEILPDKLDYNFHVKPILSDKCFSCHGPDKGKQKASLRLDVPEIAFAPLVESPGKVAIAPGNAMGSEVYHRILSDDPDYTMPDPESHLTLSAREKAILIKWIEEGAVYRPHWAFVKPNDPDLPKVKNKEWCINPIDQFVLHKLEQEGFEPAPEADKELLLRRLSLDLTGLPPSLEEIDAFINDTSPNAYEKQVDRLLASSHYGEEMAVGWLDLARFADSHGYTVDRLRDMSPYRDWVINAFNQNIPYDTFIHYQLAGDMMPNPTREMIIATAFNRNHQQNMEGGIIEEEFQAEYVADRTNTFGDAFLGVSLTCAKCHDHKFDPVSQKEYYELFSFFNNVKEAGQISWDDALPTPTLLLPTEKQEQIVNFLENGIREKQDELNRLESDVAPDFDKWISSRAFKRLAEHRIPRDGLKGVFYFDNRDLRNGVDQRHKGVTKLLAGEEPPVFERRDEGNALVLNGDAWLDLTPVGVFGRSEPFSIGLWVNIPSGLKEGVVFHKSIAERLYNFRGFHLYLKNDRLEVSITHTAPSNAITKVSERSVPRDQWIQVTMTYDGSSKASGMNLFVNGELWPMEITMDQLTKEILFNSKSEPGLQIGAWDRGYGLKGGRVDEIVVYDRALTPFEVKVLARTATWRELLAKDESGAMDALRDYYISVVDPRVASVRKELRNLRTALADSAESIAEIMVMQEMPKPKKTFVLIRGDYGSLGEEVFPNTPQSILKFQDNLPRNRYGLAQWLTDRNHPLTARVAVNRFWQKFFGTGIVKTAEDFGNQGELPSHPELLDWLAIQFQENGWDVKALNKLIVMSATYRQSSRATPEKYERDPGNRFLSRGPSFRLTAEMIRDNALAASGLLNRKIGGKSVKPYQPEGLWAINNTRYVPDTGDAVYRRSLYVVVKRSVPNPTLATFDATSRSGCVVRRQVTNTPLQALVTLNDPTFVEASRALGEQMTRATSNDGGIIDAFSKLTGRRPSVDEVATLESLRREQLDLFRQHPEKAKGWLTVGQYVANPQADQMLIAANAVVANTILNADATLTRR
jgi:hypothetical protein